MQTIALLCARNFSLSLSLSCSIFRQVSRVLTISAVISIHRTYIANATLLIADIGPHESIIEMPFVRCFVKTKSRRRDESKAINRENETNSGRQWAVIFELTRASERFDKQRPRRGSLSPSLSFEVPREKARQLSGASVLKRLERFIKQGMRRERHIAARGMYYA